MNFRKSILVFTFILMSMNMLIAGSLNPSALEFYNNIKMRQNTDMVFNADNIVSFNKATDFDVNATNTFLKLHVEANTHLLIENLKLSGYKGIIFYIEGPGNITLKNCSFNLKNGIWFKYADSAKLFPLGGSEPSLNIENCRFISGSSYYKGLSSLFLLRFGIIPDNPNGKEYRISNINILDSKFIYENTQEDSSYRLLSAITFYRFEEEISISNIKIMNDSLLYKNCNFSQTRGICFLNEGGGTIVDRNFIHISDPQFYYQRNKNIEISNNYMETASKRSNCAIYFQGPYRDIIIENNTMLGFGRTMKRPGGHHAHSPAIVFYGGRARFDKESDGYIVSKYSDNIDHVVFRNNYLETINEGIRISGSHIAIDSNTIELLSVPKWQEDNLKIVDDRIAIEVNTSNYLDPNKHITDISIRNNTIKCNSQYRSTGIQINAQNFNLDHNLILEPNNWGIIYYSPTYFENLAIDSSYIKNNTIEYGKQSISQFKTDKKRYFADLKTVRNKYSGILFYRPKQKNNKGYINEHLEISNNIVKNIDRLYSVVLMDSSNNSNLNVVMQNPEENHISLSPQAKVMAFSEQLRKTKVPKSILLDEADFVIEGDFKGDDNRDIALLIDNVFYVWNRNGENMSQESIYFLNKAEKIKAGSIFPETENIYRILSGNFDADVKEEILVLSTSKNVFRDKLEILFIDPSDKNSRIVFSSFIPKLKSYDDIISADINADGIDDIIIQRGGAFINRRRLQVIRANNLGQFILSK